ALVALDVIDPDACIAFSTLIERSSRALTDVPLMRCIEQVLWHSGAMAHVMRQPDALATLQVVRAFFRYLTALCDAHPDYTLPQVLAAIDEAKEYRLALGAVPQAREQAVAIMTVHRAKGMEF